MKRISIKVCFLCLLPTLAIPQEYLPYWDAQPYALAAEDSTFLEDLERDTFDWFWDKAHGSTGLTPDRSTDFSSQNEFISVAAVGFGLTAYGIGSERGYVTREQAAGRVDRTLGALLRGKMGRDESGVIGYRGWYYHFLNASTLSRAGTNELSSIDTALLLMGVVFARNYFDDPGSATEQNIRAQADSILNRVQWRFMLNPNNRGITAGWFPESGYIDWEYRGYNEAMFLYILGLGADDSPLSSRSWLAWTSTYSFGSTPYFDQIFVLFSPLFGHHYPQAWIDFRGLKNAEIDKSFLEAHFDYFENGRRATYANRAYAIANPLNWPNYDELEWGLTACDGPRNFGFNGYAARGASGLDVRDDGTIAPTAAGGSIPYAPEICIPTLRNLKQKYGAQLYGKYGFRDAYNDSVNWFDSDYIGIDQGAILLMLENYHSGLVWETMKKDPIIQRGLQRAGFTGGWLDSIAVGVAEQPHVPTDFVLHQNYPNPFNPVTTIQYSVSSDQWVLLRVFDVRGREVATLVDAPMPAGSHIVDFKAENLASGIYLYRLIAGGRAEMRKMVYVR